MSSPTPKNQLWNRMLNVVKPYVSVSRVATRPRATTRPPPPATEPGDPADPRFDRSGE